MNNSKNPSSSPASSAAAAQDLWLAGLDAFSQATKAATQAATHAAKQAANQVASMAANAAVQPPSLEGLFEARVAKALGRLGTPTREEMDALSAQVQHLQAALQAALAALETPQPLRSPVAVKATTAAKKGTVKKAPLKKPSPARPRTTRP